MATTTAPITPELTPTQHHVVALLSQGQSVSATARAVGIHRTTIHHWRRTQPAFALALRDSERDLADHWRTATQARADKALATLDHLLDDERTPATVRLKAVLHVLNTATSAPVPDPVERQLQEQLEKQGERAHKVALLELLAETEEEEEEEQAEEEPLPEQTVPSAIHHYSSLFTSSDDCRTATRPQPYVRPEPKIGRNQPCPCHSGRKYKHCCLTKDQDKQKGALRPTFSPSAPSVFY